MANHKRARFRLAAAVVALGLIGWSFSGNHELALVVGLGVSLLSWLPYLADDRRRDRERKLHRQRNTPIAWSPMERPGR